MDQSENKISRSGQLAFAATVTILSIVLSSFFGFFGAYYANKIEAG